MAIVRWKQGARADLENILAHIEQHNPLAAVDRVETIIASGNAWAPLRARNPIRHERELRERPVLGTRYVLVYRIEGEDLVLILAVRHGAQANRAPP